MPLVAVAVASSKLSVTTVSSGRLAAPPSVAVTVIAVAAVSSSPISSSLTDRVMVVEAVSLSVRLIVVAVNPKLSTPVEAADPPTMMVSPSPSSMLSSFGVKLNVADLLDSPAAMVMSTVVSPSVAGAV